MSHASAHLPVSNYDELEPEEIVQKLHRLAASGVSPDLGAVREYEAATQGRSEILDALKDLEENGPSDEAVERATAPVPTAETGQEGEPVAGETPQRPTGGDASNTPPATSTTGGGKPA